MDFINTEKYKDTTNGTFNRNTADTIPASVEESDEEWLSPYVAGAYPYIVRAMKYSTKTETHTEEPKITLKKRWAYTTTDSEGNTHVHSGTSSKKYTYTVKVEHHYYNIDNFKMYRISNLTVTDSKTSNNGYGGNLFADSNGETKTYTIDTSSSYNNLFSSSNGVQNAPYSCTYDNKTYTLSGTSGSSSEAKQDIESVGKEGAVNKVDLKMTFKFGNQYIKLDGKEDMLQKNETTYEYTLSGNDNFDIDSTDCNYTEKLLNYMKPTNTTDYEDFEINKLKIASLGDNGIRLLSGKVNYEIVSTNNFNIGGNNFKSKDYTYSIDSSEEVSITSNDLGSISKTFNNNNDYADVTDAKKEVRQVNILTPLKFSSDEAMFGNSYKEVVDMTLGDKKTVVIQQGQEFTVTPSMQTGHSSYSSTSYSANKFVDYYYVVCDFETNENAPYTPYKVSNGSSITLTPTSISGNVAVSNKTNNIYIVAVAKNTPLTIRSKIADDFGQKGINADKSDSAKNKILNNNNSYIKNEDSNSAVQINREDNQSTKGWLSLKRYGASYHVIMHTAKTNIINRIYDFEITDCTDLAYKNVFRESSSGDVNTTKKLAYFSGKKFLYVATSDSQIMLDRTELNTPENTIPLGPYKNTDKSYIFAPKLGYRISYDLKTTGYLAYNNRGNDRYIGIIPRYYYISKDGTNYKDNITLYYKDTNGKYKSITKYTWVGEGNYAYTSGGDYNIYFKPNDGYRYLRAIKSDDDDALIYLSKKMEKLSISTKSSGNLDIKSASDSINFPIKLTKEMMTLDTDNENYIQTWYGEFKLPNSTIAVDDDDTNSTVNNPLSDGYIGVIFDIYCVDVKANRVLYYSQNNKNISGDNTSQWDYEGYLGISSVGSSYSTSLQLEKGFWNINNDTYNKIKGTVLLYDIDQRAANDFN